MPRPVHLPYSHAESPASPSCCMLRNAGCSSCRRRSPRLNYRAINRTARLLVLLDLRRNVNRIEPGIASGETGGSSVSECLRCSVCSNAIASTSSITAVCGSAQTTTCPIAHDTANIVQSRSFSSERGHLSVYLSLSATCHAGKY